MQIFRKAPRRSFSDEIKSIPKQDNRNQGPMGSGVKPYEVPAPKQDMPPAGGFPPINTKRNVGKDLAIPSIFIFGTVAVGMMWGMNRLGQGNKQRRALKREKLDMRAALSPFLQAEEDIDYVMREDQKLKWEAEVMKDVPGWVVGENVYHGKRWAPPLFNDVH
ncbi:hypothetical protein GUITHDRAFT_146129 [Guillardia theta CCMP2712]|uniref:NADH dehydrogenase [ubiquinone] 1 alpha subcomplex subunit 13 n=2 Tax=Guillardia theta TaxID=55529 RepID=L1IJJ5_GUITC|nr:hypothetical protein GUITHDRAFT_146129 [Guillardia theta CCMP2712]EKX35985.1 hypothetical protein GUITHDRAFT_146129 [Guillardia theta CCMP2712]|eukprot:XP_005822965.1 hypothetical protein GUITHDRAFT_146129 [Guillardia theta CCMP2712]